MSEFTVGLIVGICLGIILLECLIETSKFKDILKEANYDKVNKEEKNNKANKENIKRR